MCEIWGNIQLFFSFRKVKKNVFTNKKFSLHDQIKSLYLSLVFSGGVMSDG